MRAILQHAALFLIVATGTAVFAQPQTPTKATPVTEAFEHYEVVRAALAADSLSKAAPHAKALAGKAEAAGGAAAKKAADALASAKNIEDARTHFGDLSAILVPLFQADAIPGTTAYMCPMKQKPWVQRGDQMANPYYGKAMLTCGTPLPAKAK
jgi:hypothetical protein